MINTIEIKGTNYPRVTHIIQQTEDLAKRQKLLKWIKKMEKIHGLEGAEIERQKILDNGTDLHQAIEDYLTKKKEALEHSSLQLIIPFLKIIKNEGNLIIEKRLFCHKYQYQGKPDLICNFEGSRTIIDWTTSQRMKQKEWLEHKFIQAGAYAIACEEIGIKINQLAVVVICANPRTFQVFTDSPKEWRINFLHRLGKFKAKNGGF